MYNHNIETGRSWLSSLSEVFVRKIFLSSWSIGRRIFNEKSNLSKAAPRMLLNTLLNR